MKACISSIALMKCLYNFAIIKQNTTTYNFDWYEPTIGSPKWLHRSSILSSCTWVTLTYSSMLQLRPRWPVTSPFKWAPTSASTSRRPPFGRTRRRRPFPASLTSMGPTTWDQCYKTFKHPTDVSKNTTIDCDAWFEAPIERAFPIKICTRKVSTDANLYLEDKLLVGQLGRCEK